jgi:hypothetical protein
MPWNQKGKGGRLRKMKKVPTKDVTVCKSYVGMSGGDAGRVRVSLAFRMEQTVAPMPLLRFAQEYGEYWNSGGQKRKCAQ